MPLVTLREVFSHAEKEGYAVGAFNAINMETAQAIFQAAEEERSPLILQITETTIGKPDKVTYTPLEDLLGVVKVLVEKATVPVVLHLDHGRSFENCIRCLDAGFTSVMRDGSLHEDGKTPADLDFNITETKKVVEYAKKKGASCEGELGTLGFITEKMSRQERLKLLTQPEDAKRFVEETGVDALALAFGTGHGPYKGTPILELDVISRVRKEVDIPLVMHGGTGVPPAAVTEAIKRGIRKVNIDTQIRMAFEDALRKFLSQRMAEYMAAAEKEIELGEGISPPKYDIRKYLAPARDSAKEIVKEKMRLFGCSGKA